MILKLNHKGIVRSVPLFRRKIQLQIRELNVNEKPPIDLLLQADPSRALVEEYLQCGKCYVAENEKEIIGVYVLLPTTSETIELVNIAVSENEQGKGVGKQLVLDAIREIKGKWL